jgi:hypothetical protein
LKKLGIAGLALLLILSFAGCNLRENLPEEGRDLLDRAAVLINEARDTVNEQIDKYRDTDILEGMDFTEDYENFKQKLEDMDLSTATEETKQKFEAFKEDLKVRYDQLLQELEQNPNYTAIKEKFVEFWEDANEKLEEIRNDIQ